jgi:Tfp pilus assembly protein PilO
MTSDPSSNITFTDFFCVRIRQFILAGLLAVLAVLLYHNFFLAPELNRQKQLLAQIEQINNGLKKVKAANIKAEQVYDSKSLQERESVLTKLLPIQWKRAELLRWLTKAIQNNGLIFEEQTLQEQTPQALYQSLDIHLKLNGKYVQLQQFLQILKQAPRLLVLEKLHVENPTPESRDPKLKIEMILSVYKRLGLIATKKKL